MRAVWCCLLLTLLPGAVAQRWTIQVFAYTEAARAEGVAEQLRGFGYDAYTDRSPEGLLTQVRIGCFSATTDANALAQDVRQRVALDALVVPQEVAEGQSGDASAEDRDSQGALLPWIDPGSPEV